MESWTNILVYNWTISIHLRHPFLDQKTIHLIPGTDKASYKPTPAVNTPLAKNDRAQPRKNYFNYRSVIRSLNFLKTSICTEAKFAFRKSAWFSADHKPLHDQNVKWIIKDPKGTAKQGLIMKPNIEKGYSYPLMPTSRASGINHRVHTLAQSCLEQAV